eukprot:SAG31_NODE_3679_length_3994_cov_3.349422_6_plen_162_part_00
MKAIIFAGLALISVVATVESYLNWGRPILDCGILGCLTEQHKADNNHIIIHGLIATVGTILTLVCAVAAMSQLLLIYLTLRPSKSARTATNVHAVAASESGVDANLLYRAEADGMAQPSKVGRSRAEVGSTSWWTSSALVLLVLLPAMIGACVTLPVCSSS